MDKVELNYDVEEQVDTSSSASSGGTGEIKIDTRGKSIMQWVGYCKISPIAEDFDLKKVVNLQQLKVKRGKFKRTRTSKTFNSDR